MSDMPPVRILSRSAPGPRGPASLEIMQDTNLPLRLVGCMVVGEFVGMHGMLFGVSASCMRCEKSMQMTDILSLLLRAAWLAQ